MPTTKKNNLLEYKGHPLMRKENIIYYGSMSDSFRQSPLKCITYRIISPRAVTIRQPTDATRRDRQPMHCAASSPVHSLPSYSAYFFRTPSGDRLGITTFAPACSPRSRPSGRMVPSAVVAGSSKFGWISRSSDSRYTVCSHVPAGKSRNGVSFCGINGPIPHISGRNSSMNFKSSASVRAV